ncbi:ATP-binding protein [Kribbella ginsengisoli]|uniref:Helix-turn-helix transcriptional regulator n=1 Tax=Kribbella ginsengisoli TaxID=363865 RepID=A0ABP6Z951_9ACTN
MSQNLGRLVSSPQLIGRDAEMAALTDFASALGAGGPRVTLVSGRAGSGKTRLIRELNEKLREEGVTVLPGACLALEAGSPPYLALHTALRSALPAGAPVLAELTGARATSRMELFEELRASVESIARGGKTALIIEDLHWADPATQDALSYLVAQAAGAWGLIATMRPEGADSAAALLAGLERRHILRLSLGTLSVAEVGAQMAAIIGIRPDAAEVDLVHRRSGGIPLLVEEVVAAGNGEIPDHLRAMFVARVRELGELVADVVGVASVVDRRCDETVIGQILGTEIHAARAAANEAVNWDLLMVDAEGYRVRHELLREAVYGSLAPAQRRQLHERAGVVLSESSTAEPGELAYHWYLAGRPKDATRAFLEATDLAERANAPATAYSYLERVLSLWPSLDDEDQERAGGRGEVLRRTAIAAERSGSFDAAIALTEERLAACVGDELSMAYERLARYRWQGGDGIGAAAAHDQAIGSLTVNTSAGVRAKVLSGQAWHLRLVGRIDDAVRMSDAALQQSQTVEDPAIVWQVLLSWGVARLGQEEAVGALTRARSMAESLDAGFDIAICTLWQYENLRMLGRLNETDGLLATGLRQAAAYGLSRSVEAVLSYQLIERMLETGRWTEALNLADSVLRRDVHGIPEFFTRAFRARLAAMQGDEATLEDAGRYVDAYSARIPHQRPRAIVLMARAEWSLWRGLSDGAAALCQQAVESSRLDVYYRADALAMLARARADWAAQARAQGNADDAAEQAAELHVQADAWEHRDYPEVAALLALTRAESERLVGSRDPQPWRETVDALAAVSDLYRAAYARWRLSWALLGSRSGRAEATRQLDQAHEAALALGADPLRTAIEKQAQDARLQVAFGQDAASMPKAPEFQLTTRELEVLPLLAAGRTNAEIASILVISPRTVGEHVSRILRKMGAGRRTEAADIARRRGLLDG